MARRKYLFKDRAEAEENYQAIMQKYHQIKRALRAITIGNLEWHESGDYKAALLRRDNLLHEVIVQWKNGQDTHVYGWEELVKQTFTHDEHHKKFSRDIRYNDLTKEERQYLDKVRLS